jgi:hypothetical protein
VKEKRGKEGRGEQRSKGRGVRRGGRGEGGGFESRRERRGVHEGE